MAIFQVIDKVGKDWGKIKQKDQSAADRYVAEMFGDGVKAVPEKDFGSESTKAKAVVARTEADASQSGMEDAIVAARLAAEKEERPLLSKMYPTAMREAAKTGEYGTGTATDALSMVGRYGVSPDFSGSGMEIPWDEREGWDRAISSPAAFGSMLAAPLIGATAPLWSGPLAAGSIMGGAEAVTATALGAGTDPEYGGSDVGIDVAASMVAPALGPVFKTLGRKAAIGRITEFMAGKGVKVSPERAAQIYDKATSISVKGSDASTLPGGKSIKAQGESLVREGTDRIGKSIDVGSGIHLTPELEAVKQDIAQSLAVKGPGKRTVAEAKKAESRAAKFFADLDYLTKEYEKEKKGFFDVLTGPETNVAYEGNGPILRYIEETPLMDDATYQENVSMLLREYSDIPEVIKYAEKHMKEEPAPVLRRQLLANARRERTGVPTLPVEKPKEEQWSPLLRSIREGSLMMSPDMGKVPRGEFLGEYPTIAKGMDLIASPNVSMPFTTALEQSLNFLPSVQRAMSRKEQE